MRSRRGQVVVKPGTVRSTVLVDVSFRLLVGASKPLTHNQAVDFFVGASEVSARVRLLGAEQIEPGGSRLAAAAIGESAGRGLR